jgi:hypothetical protein
MTPAHTAPEQFNGSAPSVGSDVYALASTLFTLLSGTSPFQGRPDESIFALLARVGSEPPPDLRRHGVPDALARVIEQGLAKDPQHRASSALAFGQALQAAQAACGVPVTALPVAQEDGAAPAGGVATNPLNAPTAAARFAATPAPTPPAPYPPAPYPPPPYQPAAHAGSGYPPSPSPYPTAGYPTPPGPPPPPPSPPSGPAPTPGRSRRGLVLALVAGLAAVVVVAVLVVLNQRSSSGVQVDSATSSATSSASSSPATTGPASSTSPADSGTSTDPVTQTTSAAGTGGAADGLLLPASDPTLSGWTAGGGLLEGLSQNEFDTTYCNKTVHVDTDQRAQAAYSRSLTDVINQRVYRLGAGGAAKALAGIRDSAKACSTWTEQGILGPSQYSIKVGPAIKAGDESAVFELSTATGVHTYEIILRVGDDLTVLEYGRATAMTGQDATLAGKLATAAAGRLGGTS